MSAAFDAALGRFAAAVAALAPEAADAAASEVLAAAVERTPVATGRLRDGWRIADGDTVGRRVVNDVPYAAAVEYGSRTRPGAAMARGAVVAVALSFGDER